MVILNHELYVKLVNNLAYRWKEYLSKVEVILIKDIEYGKVIGIYDINFKYCHSCITSKETLL